MKKKSSKKNTRPKQDRRAALAGTTGSGYDELWTWFGMGRASFLIVPRVLMHEMPDRWQAKMAALLREYEETFVNWPADFDGSRAQATKNGKIVKWPEWVTNYRRPAVDTINSLRPNNQIRDAAKPRSL